jgi:hypothetical protein
MDPLVIKYKIDDTQAQAATKRQIKGIADIEAGWARIAKVQEAALTKAAATADRLTQAVQKGSQQRAAAVDKEVQKTGAGVQKAATEGIKAQEKLTQVTKLNTEQRAALEQKFRERDRRDRNAYEKQRERDADGPLARQARQNRRILSNDEILMAAQNRVIDVGHKHRINAAMRAMGEEKDMFSQGIANAFGFGQAMTKVGLVVGGVVAAFKGISIVSEHYHKIATDARAAAEATLDMRKALRVEGVLKGESTATDKTLKESLGLRVKTGLGMMEASDLTRQFEGSLPIGLEKKNITRKVADELIEQVGVMQARQGGDAGTRGDLAGILGQFGKIGSAEEGLGQMEAIRQALTAGRGDDTPLTNQLLKVAGSIVREGGPVPSLPEMGAIIGVTSLSAGPEAAGTRAEQLYRGCE